MKSTQRPWMRGPQGTSRVKPGSSREGKPLVFTLGVDAIRQLLAEREPALMLREATSPALDPGTGRWFMVARGAVPLSFCEGHFPLRPIAPMAALGLFIGQACCLAASYALGQECPQTIHYAAFEANGIRLRGRHGIPADRTIEARVFVGCRRGPIWQGGGELGEADSPSVFSIEHIGMAPMSYP